MLLQGPFVRMTGDTGPGFGMPQMSPEEFTLITNFYRQMQMGLTIPPQLALPSMREQMREQHAFEAQMPHLLQGSLTKEQIDQIADIIRREENGE